MFELELAISFVTQNCTVFIEFIDLYSKIKTILYIAFSQIKLSYSSQFL